MSELGTGMKSLGGFLREVRVEFAKVTWPQRKELFESTWVVAAMILALSAFVLVCDQVLLKLLSLVM
jgi:preprotein translocase subunit SecE